MSAAEALIEAPRHGEPFWPAVEPASGWLLLLRASWHGDETPSEVWRTFLGSQARQVFEWMSSQPGEWLLWGRLAVLFGEQALRSLVIDAAQRELERQAVEQEKARIADEERERLRLTVELFILDGRDKRPGLSLQSGDETKPFFVMRFSERWERERVLDWLRWQRSQFLEFRSTCVRDGAVALERRIVAGMRVTEAKMKTDGRSCGGRRPLRFWRGEE